MDDRELDGRLTRLQTSLDILLDLEGIHFNQQTGQYEQEEEQEKETSVTVKKKQ